MAVQFTAEDYAGRMRRAAAEAVQAGYAGVLVTPGPDLVWLTGYQPTALTERMTMLILREGEPPRLVVPKLEEPDAQAATGAPVLEFVPWTDGIDPYTVTRPLLGPQTAYAVADSAWALHVLGLLRTVSGLRLTPLTDALPMLRAVKDPHELDRLAAAGAGADAAYGQILGVAFAGRKETEVAADLAALLREHGHEQVDFTVVGSGPNGANPHHEAGDRTIATGDTVVLDFGGLRDGYGSDTTRTVHVGPDVDDEVRRVHDLVRTAQQTAFEAVRPGVTCQDIDRAARKVITDGGYGEYFIHRTGHGIGVTTHEPPYMIEGERLPLVPGMCFSIEPGVYLPGRFGVRIEDIVTVTEDGGRRLNNTSHDMAIVA
ncbi:aminopeptidase P family protein [Hamadaea tsunoensis]|uniref:aminopeptidase P family protein n=1 Tax=Hamadaea tsunoensis TaxID=53368 RepID=UPI00041476A8|nr:aminopeptidase P family protein [Hamadaea tsunoensis]